VEQRNSGAGRKEELTSGAAWSVAEWASAVRAERSGSAGRTGPRGAGQAGERAGQVARARGEAGACSAGSGPVRGVARGLRQRGERGFGPSAGSEGRRGWA